MPRPGAACSRSPRSTLPLPSGTAASAPRNSGRHGAWRSRRPGTRHCRSPPCCWRGSRPARAARPRAGGRAEGAVAPPVDVAGRAKRLLWWLGGYALISFGFTVLVFVPEQHPAARAWPPGYLAWFAIGMALAVVAAWPRAEPDAPAARFCRTVGACWGTCWLAALCLYVIAASPLTGSTDLVGLDDV